MSFHIIGDEDTVLGFRFAGVTGVAVESPEAAQAAFRDAIGSGTHRILLLTEPVAAMIAEDVTAHRMAATPPFVVVVRDIWNTPTEHRSIEELIQEAVGIKIAKS